MPASEVLKKAVVTLTDAQVKALPSTPVELIAAVSGKFILPIAAFLHLNWAADYSNIHAQCRLMLKHASSETLDSFYEEYGSNVSALLAGGGPDGSNGWSVLQQRQLPSSPVSTALAGAYDSDINGALQIAADNNGAGDFTGGDSANSLKVTVFYVEVDL